MLTPVESSTFRRRAGTCGGRLPHRPLFLTVNDELPNTELEKIGEVLPRIEVPLIYLKWVAAIVYTYSGEGGGKSDCKGGQRGGSSSSGEGISHLKGRHSHLDLNSPSMANLFRAPSPLMAFLRR